MIAMPKKYITLIAEMTRKYNAVCDVNFCCLESIIIFAQWKQAAEC